MPAITHAEVRMFTMGTGDCFAVKFFEDNALVFSMMIDCGVWTGSAEHLEHYIKDLKVYLHNYADVLVVTHEHKDHVHGFAACEHLFTNDFEVGEIWMAWTEHDGTNEVSDWVTKYGEKKKVLGKAAQELKSSMKTDAFKMQFAGNKDADKAIGAREMFGDVLKGFADLHMSFDEEKKIYKGGLAGMDVVKNKIKNREIKYFRPGDVIEDPGQASGLKIYVLGPPELYEDIRKESGGDGESYDHSQNLQGTEAFSAAVLQLGNETEINSSLLPFEAHYFVSPIGQPGRNKQLSKEEKAEQLMRKKYESTQWRKIDYEWLYGAGSFSLRMNGLTNNLSLALAIEIGEGRKVMLFPGDAEFGSWASWHRIKWNEAIKPPTVSNNNQAAKNFTEDLLNRTVFYKVAHHLSHNGTAKKQGLEMMNHKDLVAMATLDYNVINDGWTRTMPNKEIVKELLARTKGRLIIMNEEKLFYDNANTLPLAAKIKEARGAMTAKEKVEFEKNLLLSPYAIQYTIVF